MKRERLSSRFLFGDTQNKYSMRRNLLLSIIIALCMPLLGNPVDENTAKQLAQNFWKENNIMGVRGDEVFKKTVEDAQFVNVAPQSGYNEFYIFNNEAGEGFVIIAADDCVIPILGYSYDNNFVIENMPPNLKGWLDGYAEQIRAAVEMRAEATEDILTEWECLRRGNNLPIKSETAVNHLLSTTWDQGEYYNMLCPEDSYCITGHVLTGCAATAMAQILRFWEYPNDAHRVIYHEYEHPVYGLLDANYSYAGGSYYWNYMPNQLSSSSSIYQKQAVASLMYHCGVSVEMDYGPNVSSAFTTAAEIAFRAFFDYNNATLVMKPSNDSQWINLLKNELDNGRPIYYAGTGPDGGHAFVCDGYNNSNYFWFNWGCSGQANGFFPVNSLTPNINGHHFNFSYNQQAIIGIEPGGTNNYHLLGLNDDIKINGDNGNMYLFDTQVQEINTEIYNWGNETFNGSLCAVVYDGEGLYMVESDHIDNCQILPMQSSGQISFTFSEPLNILTCNARVRIYLIENNQGFLVSPYGMHSNPRVFYNYYTLSDDMVELYLYSDIEYSPSSIVQNSAINVTANITNDDIVTFYGYYAAALYGLNGELEQILSGLHEGNGLQPGYHYTNPLNFSCPSVTVPAGTYYLTIIQQSEGSDNWYPLLNWEDCVNPMYVNPIRVEVVSPSLYTITATANPNNGGTITGQGEYLEGETCSLTATANSGYTFVNWMENGTLVSINANYTFTVTGNRNLVANFQQQQQQYTINVSASPSNGGTAICNKTIIAEDFEDYTIGNNIAVEALAAGHGYWTTWNYLPGSSEDGHVESFNGTQCGHLTYGNDQILLLGSVNSGVYDLKFDILVPEGKNGYFCILHHLASNNSIWAMQCYLHLTNDGQSSTSAPGHGTVHAGSTSTADLPCVYDQWMHFRIHVDMNNDIAQLYFNPLGQPENIYAEWQWSLDSFGASVTDCVLDAIDFFPPENSATSEFYVDNIVVSNQTNSFYYGDICTLMATPNIGYNFVNWTGNGTQVSTNPNYTFTVTGNRNLVANFQAQPQQYTINVSANPSNGGNVSGGGTYTQGQSCTVSASANNGYTFVNWTENGTQASSNANYTFEVNGNRTLVANFQIQSYTISVAANPSNGGTVTGGGSYEYGQICSVTANSGNGFNFVNWTENGVQVSTNSNYTFTVTGNRNLVANFTSQSYVITAIADPTAGGVVTGSGGYNYGETCTLTATPNTGYTFQRWTKNGTQVSTNPTYSFTVTESATYTAHFNAQSYTITVTANPNNAGSVTGGGSYTYGQTCTVSASANNSYAFTNWTENGTQVSTNASYSFTVTGNRNLVANFTQNAHTIHATAGANGIITPSGTVTVAHGANQSFAMIPDSDYEVQEVYIDGNPVGAMTSYTFTNVTADHYIHVTFMHVDAVGENNNNTINVYPNPTKGIVNLDCHNMVEVKVFNALGVMVKRQIVEGEDNVQIDLSAFSDGLYLLQATSPTQTTTIRVVKAE